MGAVEEIKSLIEAQGECWQQFKKVQDCRFDNIEDTMRQFRDFQLQMQSPGGSSFGLGSTKVPITEADRTVFKTKAANGEFLPTMGKSVRVADFYPKDNQEDFSLASHVRSNMLGSTKAVSSAALVPLGVSSNIIDMVRAQTTVIQAGARTIILDEPTNLARIMGDVTPYLHEEGVEDIQESDVTLSAVTLKPRAIVAVVPLSFEVVNDSPNLDQVLNASITAAFAAKLDTLALATILADSNIPTNPTGLDPNAWANILTSVGLAMAAKQTIPTSMICSINDFIERASQQADTSGNWLSSPPVLAQQLTEYPTTNVAAGTAIYGGFELGFAIAMRQQLRIEIIRFNKPLSASHHLVATMRAEGIVLQPKRLFIQKKTVA